MFKINLVPEIQEEKQKASKFNYLATVISLSILGGVIIILVILGGLIITNKTMKSSVEKDIVSIENETEQYKELEKAVISLEDGLTGAKKILDGNKTWTKLLPHLEKATPNDIMFKSLTLEEGKITASLGGKDINSLARFIESFKRYKLYTVSGKAEAGTTINLEIDSQKSIEVIVKSNGQWVYPIDFDSNVSHKILVKNSDNQIIDNIVYDENKKEATSKNNISNIKINNIFTNVDVSTYKKEGGSISFSATMTFDGSLIW